MIVRLFVEEKGRALALPADNDPAPFENAALVVIAADIGFEHIDHAGQVVGVELFVALVAVKAILALDRARIGNPQALALLAVQPHRNEVANGLARFVAKERRIVERCKPILVPELVGGNDVAAVIGAGLRDLHLDIEQPGLGVLLDRLQYLDRLVRAQELELHFVEAGVALGFVFVLGFVNHLRHAEARQKPVLHRVIDELERVVVALEPPVEIFGRLLRAASSSSGGAAPCGPFRHRRRTA
jgi:hypothetical protein